MTRNSPLARVAADARSRLSAAAAATRRRLSPAVAAARRLPGGESADYRRLGVYHLLFALAMGLWGGLDALLLRTSLLAPGAGLWSVRTYDAFFTTHGLTMLFLFATPAIWGFAYAVVPPLIGAEGTARPGLGAAGFWLLVPGALAMRAGTVGGLLGVAGLAPVATGWTLYPPMSASMPNPAVDVLLLGLLAVVVATVATACNLVATVLRRRSIPWGDVDAFTWSVLTAAAMAALSFPVLAVALVALLADRNLGTAFFAADGGPLLWQHLFWFFAHPDVYVLVLPPMGIVSHVVPRFAGRRLFGRRATVYSTLAIGVLSFTVWGHHMFTTGMDPRARTAFMFVTLAIALPSAEKTLSWLVTLWGGALDLAAPMLFALGGVAFFVVGGVTGVVLAVAPVNGLYNGTHYVVGHFHLLLVGFVAFALLSGTYYWFPLLAGREYDESLARLHFWLSAIGVAVAFGSLMALGLAGLPRRSATYPAAYAPLHQLATVGAYVIAAGQLAFLLNLAVSLLRGDAAERDPWSLDGGPSHAREWPGATGAAGATADATDAADAEEARRT